jgi:hypothetical protein
MPNAEFRMKNYQPVQSSSRSVKLAALIAFGIWHSSLGIAQAAPALTVAIVQPTRVADMVMINGGFDAGLRQGMVCRVTRGTTEIAEILVVEVRPTFSAALITSLAPKQSIHAGDAAALKILKT